MISYHTLNVNDLEIFYREAGNPSLPTMLLFHGFPSASHMFRDLMPALADHFHVIAPDYPGFGQSSAPDHTQFAYTFDHLSDIMTAFWQALDLGPAYIYVFDYGAPIGFRIAAAHPDWIRGIVSQNGNVYQAGLGAKWADRQDFWDHPTPAKRDRYRTAFAPATIRGQYLTGTAPHTVSPDGYTLDIAYTQTPGYAERQLDLIFDYQNNIKQYPQFQAYLRQHQPKLLAVWGKNDPSFIYPGAEAFKQDDPNTEVDLLDSGHFALETHASTIAQLIIRYFG
ncbi:alpha/beta fold hydrolase [Levilactobacillus angrenensis]|uniref:Alpha/beta fold hydrolase n=1 Tax=Levilactobacillus angrenensis TaxID=2486020 RepID=A0ABW1UDP1_9LACO|nr:alpha/beta hydrolase [Levilactobacillus angrenensis]